MYKFMLITCLKNKKEAAVKVHFMFNRKEFDLAAGIL